MFSSPTTAVAVDRAQQLREEARRDAQARRAYAALRRSRRRAG